ncbi:MAG: LacI family DNA-binding transcriptional regulator, partial [Gammaproteobacteria bacterium]
MPRKATSPPSGATTDAADQARPRGPESGSARQRVQMADIARMAGVSASTVSRALSGSPLIPEATRQRITELARSLNYQINVGAANLRKRDTRTVGVVLLGESLQAISDPFILSILGAVGDRLDELDMSLLLSRLKHGQPQQLAQRYDSGQVLGLIVIGQTGWHDELNRLAARGVPMAVWGACL